MISKGRNYAGCYLIRRMFKEVMSEIPVGFSVKVKPSKYEYTEALKTSMRGSTYGAKRGPREIEIDELLVRYHKQFEELDEVGMDCARLSKRIVYSSEYGKLEGDNVAQLMSILSTAGTANT